MKDERGFSLLETLVALAILGVAAAVFLSSLATTSKATIINEEQTLAESLVRSQVEYVKSCTYQPGTSEYDVNPALTVPVNWSVPPPAVAPLHGSDDGIQIVTVSALRNGETILSVETYKVDR